MYLISKSKLLLPFFYNYNFCYYSFNTATMSFHPSVHPSVHPSTHLFIHQSILPSIHPFSWPLSDQTIIVQNIFPPLQDGNKFFRILWFHPDFVRHPSFAERHPSQYQLLFSSLSWIIFSFYFFYESVI